MSKNKCGEKTEIYSRVCGYHRPVRNWNRGKQEEFSDRKTFNIYAQSSPHTHAPKPMSGCGASPIVPP